LSSISSQSLLFGSFLFILIILTSLGSSAISFMFLKGQTEGLKSIPQDKSIAFKLTASNTGVITISESKAAVNNIAASNSNSFHSHSSINLANTNKFAKSVIPLANLTNTSSATKSRDNYSDKTLSISIQSTQKIVNGRGTSTVTAIAYDGSTGREIENAVVIMKITFASNNTSKEIVGRDGHVTFSAQIGPNSKDNSNISFKSTVRASAPGYISTSKAISSYSFTSLSHHDEEKQSIINNNGSSELALNILKDVQKKLEQNGIRFALGK